MIDDLHLAMKIVQETVKNGRLLHYTWDNTIAIVPSSPRLPATIVPPQRIRQTIKRLRTDGTFRNEVLAGMRKKDIEFYVPPRWDNTNRTYATERAHKMNVVRNRDLERRDIVRQTIPYSPGVSHEGLANTLLTYLTPQQLPSKSDRASSPTMSTPVMPPALSIPENRFTPMPLRPSLSIASIASEAGGVQSVETVDTLSSATPTLAKLPNGSQKRSFVDESPRLEDVEPLDQRARLYESTTTPFREQLQSFDNTSQPSHSSNPDLSPSDETLSNRSPTTRSSNSDSALHSDASSDDDSQPKSFVSYATNASVLPIKASFRPGFEDMMGIVAVENIPAGALILAWSGVDVDADEFQRTRDHLCNREHVLAYALEYVTDSGPRVVCPRLNQYGRPEVAPTATPSLDVCWACLINEPMQGQRASYRFEKQAIVFTKSKKNKANARIAVAGGRAIVIACEQIKKGDEITMRYTDAYKGKHSYNAGEYRVGAHAAQRHCPDIHIHWTDLSALSAAPEDVFKRYLLPRDHGMATSIDSLLKTERRQVAMERQKADDRLRSFSHRRDMIPTMIWRDVERAQEAAVRVMLQHDSRTKLHALRVRIIYILFVPLEIEPVWMLDERRIIHHALFDQPETPLVVDVVVYIWKQLDAIVTDGRRKIVDCMVTKELATLLEEHSDEAEVAIAAHELAGLRKTAEIMTKYITTDEQVSVMMEDFRSLCQRTPVLRLLRRDGGH